MNGLLAKPGLGRRLATGSRRGITIFQVMLGMLVAGVAVVGAIDFFNSAEENRQRNEAALLLHTLRANVQKIYAGDPNYGADDTDLVPTLVARGGVPDKALVGEAIQPGFGGAVTVVGNPEGDGATLYRITFEDLDAESCGALADLFVGRTRARTGIVDIQFGGDGGGEQAAPVTRDEVTTGCDVDADADETVDLGFTFG
ncbi:MAG: type 4 pilus major pilin [Defluviicoccus sp.]|nr:type 4 pilus major pilin [Defluviicoccus sp.]MDE0278166.1 type 4 pilus major pilin [Defluviicoccus sp.]